MMKFKSKRFGIRFGFGKRTNNKGTQQDQQQKGSSNNNNNISSCNNEIKWELRPGGMLVQKRQESIGEDLISIRVSTFANFHDLSIEATSTFGELKMVLSLLTGLEPKQQRLLFKGKEREDDEYLHMVGVGEKDKVLLLEDPAFREKKLLDLNNISASCPTIIV
ncbi:Ubiquitin-like superfamily protein [Raphanus sativus]|uniref:BAG family molecular chaperone regulator 2 n=1 Tax=Raphanus sativus TaxID=3726 RepID=A0A6J0MQA8_RAPSA|nr:BAG family molecular chaperone regulator 2 [Raphanus sativus]KAJ4908387.1 Ubiquitin-like superfamily protein [Raphanus sativus]